MDMNNINMGSILQTFSHMLKITCVTLRFSLKMVEEEKCLLHNETQYVVLRFNYNGNFGKITFAIQNISFNIYYIKSVLLQLLGLGRPS
jgi:hypothetical protein